MKEASIDVEALDAAESMEDLSVSSATPIEDDDGDILAPPGGSCVLAAIDLFENTPHLAVVSPVVEAEAKVAEVIPIAEPEDKTLPDCSVAECWKLYLSRYKDHTLLTANDLCCMMQSVIDAIAALGVIDEGYYQMVADSLAHRYFDLEVLARARGIKDFPLLVQPLLKVA